MLWKPFLGLLALAVHAQEANPTPCLRACRTLVLGCVLQHIQPNDYVALMDCVMFSARDDALIAQRAPTCRYCMMTLGCEPAHQVAIENDINLNDPTCGNNFCHALMQEPLEGCLFQSQSENPCDTDDTLSEEGCLAVESADLRICDWHDDAQQCTKRGEFPGGGEGNQSCADKANKRSQCVKLEGCRWDIENRECVAPGADDGEEVLTEFRNIDDFNAFANQANKENCDRIGGKFKKNKNPPCRLKTNGTSCKFLHDKEICESAGCKWKKAKKAKGNKKAKVAKCKNKSGSIFD